MEDEARHGAPTARLRCSAPSKATGAGSLLAGDEMRKTFFFLVVP
jgi:hypothetical protein